MPSTSRASVRARINVSRRFSEVTARIFAIISAAGITSLPAIWPQRFGASWASNMIADTLVGVQGVHRVLDIAIAVVAVDHDGQIAGRHNVGDGGGDLAERDQADVGQSPTRADRGEAAGEIRLETGTLDQPRTERIEC